MVGLEKSVSTSLLIALRHCLTLTIFALGTLSHFLLRESSIPQTLNEIITHEYLDIYVFANWLRATQKTQLLFYRTYPPILQRLLPLILQYLQKHSTIDPFWPYVIMVNLYLDLQHTAVFTLRDLTEWGKMSAENLGLSRQLEPSTDYGRLHEVLRHSITLSELLQVSVKMLEHMLNYHQSFMDQPTGSVEEYAASRKVHQRLLLYSHKAYSEFCRCASYRDRMKNDIQLALNVVSQDEARASVEIAKASKSDSQAMKVTSLIALVFLPPTYVSAVFSTSFFDFGTDSSTWAVSDKVWIYWAFCVPLTLLSVMFWFTWIFNESISETLGVVREKFGRRRRRRSESLEG
ncbi:hypothetical protein B0J14DRAFT_669371 [Halenospora varia]|nr:hypothetical protein B0J14DRAFT_669371 [Halenospora varia]